MAKPKRKVSKGTGQKYQTEPAQESSTPRQPRQGYPESSLRRRLERYVTSESFRPEARQAVNQYFGQEITTEEDWNSIEEVLGIFLEWFTFDYTLSSGKRVIDVFQAEVGPQLSSTQKGILSGWVANKCLRLLEVQTIEPGVKFTAKDLLNGEVLEIGDVLASHKVLPWMILLARPEWSTDRTCLSPEVYPLRPRDRQELLETAQKLWSNYQQQHPQNSLLDFYRQHSLDLILVARRIEEEEVIPQTPITEEGHEVCFCTAFFNILSNSEEVAALLMAAEEFEFASSDDDNPDVMNFNWLKCGRSNVPQAKEKPAKAVILKSEQSSPDGTETKIYLGGVSLWEKEIWLNTVSVERMEAGKLLLGEILGDHIRHQDDEDELITWQEKMEMDDEDDIGDFGDDDFDDDDFDEDDFDEEEWEEDDDEDATPEEIIQINEKWGQEETEQWLDESILELNNLTPRQAAQDPLGRSRLIAMLKDFEFRAAFTNPDEGTAYDTNFLRQELGITDEDMLA